MKSKLWDIDKFLVNVQHQGGGGGAEPRLRALAALRYDAIRYDILR